MNTLDTHRGNHRNVLAAASFLSTVAFSTTYGLAPVLLEAISEEFKVSPERFGSAIYFVQFSVFMATVFSVGIFGAHLNKRRLLWVTTLLLGAALVAIGKSHTSFMLLALLGVGFAGCGCIELTTSTLMVTLYPKRSRAMLNISQVFYGIGAVGGPLAAIVLLRHYGQWRTPFLFVAALPALALPLYFFGKADEGHAQERTTARHVAELLRKSRFWVFVGIMILYVGMELSFACWVPTYLGDRYNLKADDSARGLAPVLFWGMMAVGRFLIAFIPRGVRHTTVISAIQVAVIGALVVFFAAPSLQLQLAACGLLGFAMCGLWPTNLALAESHFPERQTTVIALVIAAGALGATIFPSVVGLIADRVGLVRTLPGVVVLAVAGAILSIVAHRRLPEPPARE